MKTIPIEFMGTGEVKGIRFRQLIRLNDLCLYSRSDGYFEVIRVRLRKECTRIIGNKIIFYEEKEHYPRGDQWTHLERCFTNEVRAMQWFDFAAYRLGYIKWYASGEFDGKIQLL